MSGKTIAIRMYNVGFGDCFLLRFPCKGGERKVLIDCGVHQAGPGPHPIADVVQQVISDVTEHGKARIDVVIATHRHRDHVLGFEDEAWRGVEAGEVWMPWTEGPGDAARRIREAQSKKALALVQALRAANAPAAAIQIAENNLTNAKAIAMLKSGFAGRPKLRFLPPRSRNAQTFESELLPGVTVHAIGPSHDEEVIRDMDPPKGQSYLRLTNSNGSTPGLAPFDSRFVFGDHDADAWLASVSIKRRQLRRIEQIADEDPLLAAAALDQAVNGTSLMLMFEMGNAYLLFPGDAQWGTWQAALSDPEWHDLLEKTTFLKVGHHGSHNATPRDFVEKVLAGDFAGMVCTRTTTRYPQIPRMPLIKELKERSHNRIARSDDLARVTGFRRNSDISTDTVAEV